MTATQLILGTCSFIVYMFKIDIARGKRDLKHECNLRNLKQVNTAC